MMTVATWILATSIALAGPAPVETPQPVPIPDRQPVPVSPHPTRIDVPCDRPGALPRALTLAERVPEADIFLDGVCTGYFTILSGKVSLRGATPDSGIAAPAGNPERRPVLDIADARVSLIGLVVSGGFVGVQVRGGDADVFLSNVEVREQLDVGVYVDDGAEVRVFDSTLADTGSGGLAVRGNSTAFVQRAHVSGHRFGVDVADRSFLGLSDTIIENNSELGLGVWGRSDANVLGGEFRENGEVHLSSRDWSSISLLFGPTIGSATDSTPWSMGATRSATISSYGTSDIHGDASALAGASLRLGNTVLHGDLTAIQFADAHVRNAEITGTVACLDGADVICSATTTGGSFGCASTTCGASTAAAVEHGERARRDAAAEMPAAVDPRSPLR